MRMKFVKKREFLTITVIIAILAIVAIAIMVMLDISVNATACTDGGAHTWGDWEPGTFSHSRTCTVCGETESEACDFVPKSIDDKQHFN